MKTLPVCSEAALRDALGLNLCRLHLPSADVSYVDEGEGRPIVLLHGAPLTSLGLTPLVRHLRRECRVLAPDFPGFGRSTPREPGPYSLHDYAESVVQFVRALDLNDVTIFVHDSSGPIGLAAAAKVRDRVAGLVVADTVPIPLTGRSRLVRIVLEHVITSRPARWLNRRTNGLAWLVANVAPMHRRLPRDIRLAMVADFRHLDQRDRTMDVFAAMAREDDFLRRTAHAVDKTMKDVPTLLVYGQFDPMRFVGGCSRYRKLLPRSTTVIVPWEEHFPMLGSADVVGESILEWMRLQLPDSRKPLGGTEER